MDIDYTPSPANDTTGYSSGYDATGYGMYSQQTENPNHDQYMNSYPSNQMAGTMPPGYFGLYPSAYQTQVQKYYVCGCGKSYHSSGALASHTNKKHRGVQPVGSSTIRKDPRRIDLVPLRDIKQLAWLHPESQDGWSKKLSSLMSMVVIPNDKSVDSSVPAPETLIDLAINYIKESIKDFPESLPEFEILQTKLLTAYKSVCQSNACAMSSEGPLSSRNLEEAVKEIIYNHRSKDHALSCYDVIAYFLICAAQHILTMTVTQYGGAVPPYASMKPLTASLFLELFLLLSKFAYSVNRYGFTIEKECGIARKRNTNIVQTTNISAIGSNNTIQDSSSYANLPYCAQRDSEYLMEMVMNFLAKSYPDCLIDYFKWMEEHNTFQQTSGKTSLSSAQVIPLLFFVVEDKSLMRAVYFFSCFGTWLKGFKLTKAEIEFKGLPPISRVAV